MLAAWSGPPLPCNFDLSNDFSAPSSSSSSSSSPSLSLSLSLSMGSGSSRLGSSDAHPHRRRAKVNRTKRRLASLICGASSSTTTASSRTRREDCSVESLENSTDYCPRVVNKSPSLSKEPVFTSDGGTTHTGWSCPTSERGDASESSITSSEHCSAEDDSHIESSGNRKCFSESDQVGSHHPICAERRCYLQKQGDFVTASSTGQIPPASVNSNIYVISNDDDSVGSDLPQTNVDVTYPSSVQHEEPEGLPSIFEEITEIMANSNSDSGPIRLVSDPDTASRSRGDDAIEEVIPSASGHPASHRGQPLPEGSLIHVDVVSIFSDAVPNINNDISAHEARRNNRRTFLDALSSRSSRRHADFPAILFTAEDADLMGSRRRWLLDIGDDFFDDGVGVNSWHLSRRNRVTNDRRNSRSEFWDRLRGGAYQSSRHTSCPFDLHPDGSCSCELEEEASALSSISRIVLLAEALFEVLDEIHRQPDSFSLSLLSVPAPESVVDSLPLRTFTKTADCGDDVDQCHICLVEYEEGDKVRVLPCQHEYHMSCVDKWLKEVHGVCPLCRGDVRGVIEGAAPSSSSVGLT